MGLVVALRTGLRRGSDFGLLLLSDDRIAVFIKYYLFRIELKAISSCTVVLGFLIVAVADVVNARDVGIGWLDELAMILLESGVIENRLESNPLTATLGLAHPADIAPQTLRGSARLAHTSLEQLLHEEC